MKTKLTRAAGLLLLLLTSHFLFAASGGGSIMGQVVDPDTKDPVDGAMVVLENQGTEKLFYTNEKGYYYASNIPAGVYKVTVSYLSHKSIVEGVKVSSDESYVVDVALAVTTTMTEIPITTYRVPLVDDIDIRNGTLERNIIKNMPLVSVGELGETQAATVKIGNDYYVRGARAGGMAYYIDGGKVMGSPNIPLCGLQTYRMYDGFIPAKYGDALGGVVVIETRNYFSEQH